MTSSPSYPDHSNRRYAKRGEYVVRCVAGETILVPVTAGVANLDAIYVLNGAAAVVWGGIDGRATVHDLVAAVTAEYDVTEAEAAADVIALLDDMSSDGLVAPVDGGHSTSGSGPVPDARNP